MNYKLYVFLVILRSYLTQKYTTVCPAVPESIENGKATVEARPRPEVNVFGMIVSYECNQGYFLSPKHPLFFCGKNGEWDSKDLNPKCVKGS